MDEKLERFLDAEDPLERFKLRRELEKDGYTFAYYGDVLEIVKWR